MPFRQREKVRYARMWKKSRCTQSRREFNGGNIFIQNNAKYFMDPYKETGDLAMVVLGTVRKFLQSLVSSNEDGLWLGCVVTYNKINNYLFLCGIYEVIYAFEISSELAGYAVVNDVYVCKMSIVHGNTDVNYANVVCSQFYYIVCKCCTYNICMKC